MSNGFVFCTECLMYRRWEDVHNRSYPNGFLTCDHGIESICISRLTPHIHSDDRWENVSINDIRRYIRNWKNKEHTIPCECCKVHLLNLTFETK